MQKIGNRLRALRDSTGFSQAKLAKEFGITQSSLNRYENGQSTPTVEIFRKYADYFNVSMDYIFARTEHPEGINYKFEPRNTAENENLKQFIEMCFDPESPLNGRLKESLFRMMEKPEEEA